MKLVHDLNKMFNENASQAIDVQYLINQVIGNLQRHAKRNKVVITNADSIRVEVNDLLSKQCQNSKNKIKKMSKADAVAFMKANGFAEDFQKFKNLMVSEIAKLIEKLIDFIKNGYEWICVREIMSEFTKLDIK
ncbi:hypothetical protein KAR91_68765 [Candidatus Pacearchaeota archaeon]|nr:hypothetical protein [Candidatus Pacearchaeota archaeon]